MNTLMKLFAAMLAAIATSLLAAGCTDDLMETEGIEEGYINISLNSRELSRATEADVDNLNENLISSALVCLYPNNNPGGSPAVVKYLSNLDIHSSGIVKVRLNADLQKQLFPDNASSCSAYVIANISAEEAGAVTTDTPLSDLQMRAIRADFASKEPQPSFHMDGSTTEISLDAKGKTAVGYVDMRRVASKINLSVQLAEAVTDALGNTWTPAATGIVALISNGVNRSTFTPSGYTPTDDDYFSTRYGNTATDTDSQRELTRVEEEEYPYQLQQPFYTYPNRWDAGDLSRTNMTYLTLRVPWQRRGESSYRYCYYTVPVVKGAEIGRNISYRVKIKVNMLGSFIPDEPLELTDLSYYAVEWGSVNDDVKLLENRYLVVDQNEFSLENLESLSVPVYSSHDIYIKDVEVTYFRYNYRPRGVEQAITFKKEQWEKSLWMNPQTKTEERIYNTIAHNPEINDSYYWVRFIHKLLEWTPCNASGNAIDLTFNKEEEKHNGLIEDIHHYVRPEKPDTSYTRYIAKITISHEDLKGTEKEKNYEQVLTITQYPAIYIEATKNFTNEIDGTGTLSQGNAYVNSMQGNTGWGWNRTYALGAALNSCPCQYIITVTHLPTNTDYIIGDPRVQESTTLTDEKTSFIFWNKLKFGQHYDGYTGYTEWFEAPHIDGTPSTTLKYYYPTDSTVAKARWIAPKFRIASSYGACSSKNNFNENRIRCASYQEMGRPAGRWRMPTVAEIEYIMRLADERKIPELFTIREGSYYFSAQGRINTMDFKNNNKRLKTLVFDTILLKKSSTNCCTVRFLFVLL